MSTQIKFGTDGWRAIVGQDFTGVNVELVAHSIAKYVYEREKIVIDDVTLHTSINDFRPELNAGYTFFLNRNITVEPEAYYEISCDNSDKSGFGVRVGLSIYFNL